MKNFVSPEKKKKTSLHRIALCSPPVRNARTQLSDVCIIFPCPAQFLMKSCLMYRRILTFTTPQAANNTTASHMSHKTLKSRNTNIKKLVKYEIHLKMYIYLSRHDINKCIYTLLYCCYALIANIWSVVAFYQPFCSSSSSMQHVEF